MTKESLKDAVAANIREGILSGELRPNTRLDQEKISDDSGSAGCRYGRH